MKKLTIAYAKIDDLNLDPRNPRLGRENTKVELGQEEILDLMRDWSLTELAESFLINGFWPQEALITVREALYKQKDKLIVVEGNRRLAALKALKNAVDGNPANSYWADLIKEHKLKSNNELFNNIPFIDIGNRSEVSAYLGFRHVTGIKEWNPAEKAQYIAKLIEEDKLTYDQVRRKIGSKTPVVRNHYIAYKLLLQMENEEDVAVEKVEEKFSVLYLSLRTQGAKKYLHIDLDASEGKAKTPVPKGHLKNLVNFAKWLFGDEKTPPLFTDSRNVDDFGKILEDNDAVEYLERTEHPSFDLAKRKAGVGEDEVVSLISKASDNIQLALTDVHVYKKSPTLGKTVSRLSKDFQALLNIFPLIKADLRKELEEDAGNS